MSASILNKILSSPTASTPACNRARDYSKNDDDDDSSSYFQRTVCLFDWWLIKAEKDFHGKRLAVAGFTSRELQAMRVFTSAPIVKRFDVFTLETADGICIILKGFINKSRTIQNGFSYEVFSHFVFGFPTNWEAYTEKLFGKELMTGTGSATFSNVNKSAAVLESVAGLENSVSNATQSKYKKENDRRNHNLENIRDYTESSFERITTNGSKGLESTNLTTEQNNIDNAKNYTSDNLSPLVICVTETVSSLEDDLAVPGEPSNHHVTESSERVANSESNVKCNEGTIRDSRMEEPSNLECTFMNSAMGKSPVPNDSDNLKLSHLDPVVSRGNSGVEWVTISSSLKITAMQKENDQNKDGLNYGKKDCFTACLFQDSETILTCAGEKSSGVENLNLLSSGLKVMPKNLLFTFPIDGNPNVPEVLGNYINDATRFPVVPSAMNINSTPSRVDINAIKFTPSNFGGGKGTSSLRNLGNQKKHSEFSGSDKVKSKELMSEVSELLGENLKRCSSQGTIHSERIMDTPEAVRSQSIRRMIRNLLKNSKGKEKEGQTVVCGLKARRRKINSVSVISNQKSNTIQNDILECDNLFNLSDDELEDPTDNTLVKDNSKQRRDRRKISQTGTPRKNVKNFAQRLSGPSDGDCQSDIQTAVGEKEKSAQQLGSSRKKAHRKINFDIHASLLTRERKEKISIISPESLSLKRSRSGRLLLPSLDFWRNQVAVYDADRKITGIQEAVDDVKPSKGSKSEPRIKRRQ